MILYIIIILLILNRFVSKAIIHAKSHSGYIVRWIDDAWGKNKATTLSNQIFYTNQLYLIYNHSI